MEAPFPWWEGRFFILVVLLILLLFLFGSYFLGMYEMNDARQQ